MADVMFHLSGAVAMLVVIAFSFYMVRNTRGKMSEGFKIMLVGHMPILLLHMAEAGLAYGGAFDVGDFRLEFLEQTAQVIAALSIFIAIYLIKNMVFTKFEDAEDER